MFSTFLEDLPPEPTQLEPHGSWPAASHRWALPELRALAAAGFSGRPLLVKGEPGAGKSQLARAAAARLGWRFEYEVITPRLEPQDLLWRFDAVRRLADAGTPRALREDSHYVTPGALWRALDPVSAAGLPGPASERTATEQAGCVLLLDEIDKADSDVPNSLLEALGNRKFKTSLPAPLDFVPTGRPSERPGLLVVITSNDERELPLAFVRRCVVLEIKVPDGDATAFADWLVQRGSAHFAGMNEGVRRTAAELVWRDRMTTLAGQGSRPGLAEYMDLLRALDEITHGQSTRKATQSQMRWLRELSPYVLRKQGQDQTPDAEPAEPRA